MSAQRNVRIQAKTRQIVATNIKNLVDHRYPGTTSRAMTLAKFLGCSTSQAQRLLSGSHGFTIESIGLVADKFGVAIWQIFVPGLDPKNLPRLSSSHARQRCV